MADYMGFEMTDAPRKVIRGGPVQIFLPDYSEQCPLCRTPLDDIDHGFGLAFGGYGAYIVCPNDNCDWWIKECEVDEERADG